MRIQAFENWLAIIGESATALHYIGNLDGLTVDRVQAAFDAQYGKGEFKVTHHGTIIAVLSYRGYVKERIEKGEAEATVLDRIQKVRAIMD